MLQRLYHTALYTCNVNCSNSALKRFLYRLIKMEIYQPTSDPAIDTDLSSSTLEFGNETLPSLPALALTNVSFVETTLLEDIQRDDAKASSQSTQEEIVPLDAAEGSLINSLASPRLCPPDQCICPSRKCSVFCCSSPKCKSNSDCPAGKTCQKNRGRYGFCL
uniref:Uncharacterized protein n=1 Tax=Ditylenchus dipsaci TaxID=166011 RepID=A0A915D0C3_9BILA